MTRSPRLPLNDPPRNDALLEEVIGAIRANQDRWHQGGWISVREGANNECETSGCFAGWAAMLTGCSVQWRRMQRMFCGPDGEPVSVSDWADKRLGLNHIEHSVLFFATTDDVDEMHDVVKRVINNEFRGVTERTALQQKERVHAAIERRRQQRLFDRLNEVVEPLPFEEPARRV